MKIPLGSYVPFGKLILALLWLHSNRAAPFSVGVSDPNISK